MYFGVLDLVTAGIEQKVIDNFDYLILEEMSPGWQVQLMNPPEQRLEIRHLVEQSPIFGDGPKHLENAGDDVGTLHLLARLGFYLEIYSGVALLHQ